MIMWPLKSSPIRRWETGSCAQTSLATPGKRLITPGAAIISGEAELRGGDYQLLWRNRIFFGESTTEHNDSWARLLDSSGNPVNPDNNNVVSADGWLKAYTNQANIWNWNTSNRDHDPHALRWENLPAGRYTFEASIRSFGHALDRVVLYNTDTYTWADDTGRMAETGTLDGLPNSSNQPGTPLVTIEGIDDGDRFTAGQPVMAGGTITDAQEGNLTPRGIWRSSLDGALGIGSSADLSGLNPGTHTISLSVKDEDGYTGSSEIRIEILPPLEKIPVTLDFGEKRTSLSLNFPTQEGYRYALWQYSVAGDNGTWSLTGQDSIDGDGEPTGFTIALPESTPNSLIHAVRATLTD